MIPNLKTVMFFKVPIPGQAKTRLIPALGAEGAAALSEAMALDCLHTAMAAGLTPEIAVAGPMDHPFVTALLGRGLKVSPQVDGDLGARMSAAMGPGPAMALGGDAPALRVTQLQALARGSGHVNIGATEDGGYWGISWPERQDELLRDMPWSTPNLCLETLLRASRLGLTVGLAPKGWDVDEPQDLLPLRDALLQGAPAPRTRAALARLLPPS
ncbi:DUF2064 domain-containing protein [Myxococcota bacterium]|nr:DUF2064 domain-containing protein [Myxococcota bacterium]